jgi:hypothetical protein
MKYKPSGLWNYLKQKREAIWPKPVIAEVDIEDLQIILEQLERIDRPEVVIEDLEELIKIMGRVKDIRRNSTRVIRTIVRKYGVINVR